MIIFELIALDIPYREITKSYEISEAIINGKLPILPSLSQEYDGLLSIFKQCLSLNPEERPKAKELVTMLKSLQTT